MEDSKRGFMGSLLNRMNLDFFVRIAITLFLLFFAPSFVYLIVMGGFVPLGFFFLQILHSLFSQGFQEGMNLIFILIAFLNFVIWGAIYYFLVYFIGKIARNYLSSIFRRSLLFVALMLIFFASFFNIYQTGDVGGGSHVSNIVDYLPGVLRYKILSCDSEPSNNFRCFINIPFTTDASFCSQTSNKNDCYHALADMRKTIDLCREIDQQEIADQCFSGVASVVNEVNYCEYITDEKTKGFCIETLARLRKDPYLCNRIADEENRRWCYMDLSKEAGIVDTNICAGLVQGSSFCYANIAIKTQSSALCEEAKDVFAGYAEDGSITQENKEYGKDSCYNMYAQKTKDVSVCNKITDSFIREACFNNGK